MKIDKNDYKLDIGLGVLKAKNFSSAYAELNKEIFINGDRQDSRNGVTAEVLQFKTMLTDQTKRCVGGYGRGINIFFLLAESLWIVNGHSDVKFMDIFNSNLKNYSDDGISYHAPYGFRLRNYGVSSSGLGNMSLENGLDQLTEALDMLDKDHDSRRVAATLWNPHLDLNVSSKDLPCNDLLLWKIRNGKLNITIGNRSNDLHWGLTTNIFQFSMINEIMARTLNVETGNQVHNSDSLHIYRDSDDCTNLLNRMEKPYNNIYDKHKSSKLNFNFSGTLHPDSSAKTKFLLISTYIEKLMNNLKDIYYEDLEIEDNNFCKELLSFSSSLFEIYSLLKLYVGYKKAITKNSKEDKRDPLDIRVLYLKKFLKLNAIIPFKHEDFYVLSLNFIMQRIDNSGHKDLAEESIRHLVIPEGLGNY